MRLLSARRPVAGENLHDAILTGQLDLLDSLLLEILFRCQNTFVLESCELSFEIDVFVVIPLQLRIPLDQGLYELFVFLVQFLYSRNQHGET